LSQTNISALTPIFSALTPIIPARFFPPLALLAGASIWGVIWYPYRLLNEAGLDGPWSTALTYGTALLAGTLLFAKHWREARRAPWGLALLAAAVGWSNLAYVLGILEGEVMRVLLLFYLAPLWTVPLAWLFLGERLDAKGAGVMALALAGAVVMLWRPELGAPWPASRAEWLGVAAGILFAVGNVLVRRIRQVNEITKSLAILAGVTIAALAHLASSRHGLSAAAPVAMAHAALIVGVGLALVAMSLALQYGITRLPANRAIVILLFELVVAAIASWLLAGEVLRFRDAIGGMLIATATLVAALERRR
jgi:drug/metabolite transporter (DMT)-like permease